MLSRLRTRRHLARSEFARAIVSMGEQPPPAMRHNLAYAYYRLGMYASAAAQVPGQIQPVDVLPLSVSLAACGQYERARDVLQAQPWRRLPKPERVRVADALAPFMPQAALQLAQTVRGQHLPPALHAALLLRDGQQAPARAVLDAALAAGLAGRHPELHLYHSMALADAPARQLQRLNRFLAVHGLPGLALRDAALPPSPCNVRAAHALPPVDGPLVSVLMTTFRTGARAAVAIESLLAQTWRNLEVIVVDDASGDGTADLVQAWAERDGRVRLLRLPGNVGTYLAKSMGLRWARGEFVTCHDSDDWSHPLKIERQMRPLLKDASLVATTSNWVRMQDDGMFHTRQVHPLVRLNPSSPLFRKHQVLRQAGAWDAVRTGADSEFHARLKLVFGRRAVRRVPGLLALGAHRMDSLMNAPGTGYGTGGADMTTSRLDYWEAWAHWHLDCLRQGRPPHLPRDLVALAQDRPFAAPAEICVSPQQVRAALSAANDAMVLDAHAGHAPSTGSAALAHLAPEHAG